MLAVATGLVGMLCARPALAATPEEIDAAIKKGVGYLYSRQNDRGHWEKKDTNPGGTSGADEGQWGGRTALVTYALLAAGEKPLDPRIVKATDFLREAPITGHYSLGVRANVWLHLPLTEPNKQAMLKDLRLLVTGISRAGKNAGFYDYQAGGGRLDISCSQYGVLGAWAAAQRQEIPPAYWTLVENSWRAQQGADGSWCYSGKPQPGATGHNIPSIQMTAAGVATLFITQEFLHADEGLDGTKGNIVDPWINKGLAWVAKAFPDLIAKPNNYALYGIERIGVASGYKYFNNLDWFEEGSNALIKKQGSNGAFGDEINTSFALLFLSRGRAPVIMNKLQYNITAPKSNASKEANWNQRPRDAANVARWVMERTERTLNWQIINLNVANIHDLHDSHILYISGNQTLSFTDKEKEMLKQFVEEGGLIIGNADVGKADFTKGFRQLASDLFPGYEFFQLNEKLDHPLMNNQQYKASEWKRKPRIEALGNRARLFMVLIPNDDFSRTMQKRDYNRDEVFAFFANAYLYFYDNKQEPRYKGQTHVVRADPKIQPTTTIKVARLKYNGQWDPEPGAWKRMAAVMNNTDKVKVEAIPVELGKDPLSGYKIAHLTGTDQFAFTDDQRKALKEFVTGGGLLIIDACGGFGEFNGAVQAEITRIFPEQAASILEPLKGDHKLFTLDAAQKIEPKYRNFAMQKLTSEALRFRIRGLEINGKLGVIYSPDDLSVGMMGSPVDGIIGYDSNLATTLMRRFVMLKNAGKI